MASQRLSSDLKSQILGALLSRAFDARGEALDRDEFDLGQKVCHDLYSAAERKTMEALTEDFLQTANYQRVNFGGDFCRLFWGEKRLVAARREAPSYSASHPLTDAYRELRKKREDLKNEKGSAKREASATLSSVTTVARLFEVWPEIKPIVEPLVKADKRPQLPILRTEVLNQKFRPPVSKGEKSPTKKAARK